MFSAYRLQLVVVIVCDFEVYALVLDILMVLMVLLQDGAGQQDSRTPGLHWCQHGPSICPAGLKHLVHTCPNGPPTLLFTLTLVERLLCKLFRQDML